MALPLIELTINAIVFVAVDSNQCVVGFHDGIAEVWSASILRVIIVAVDVFIEIRRVQLNGTGRKQGLVAFVAFAAFGVFIELCRWDAVHRIAVRASKVYHVTRGSELAPVVPVTRVLLLPNKSRP